MACERLWLSWEKQRRTLVLADEFSAELIIHESRLGGIFRYLELIPKTLNTLIKTKPRILFVQNPSIILALVACLARPIFGYTLVIDRHTNFKLNYRHSWNIKWIGFHCISKLTNSLADVVLVTNKYLALLTGKQTRKTFVLPDRLPSLPDNIKTKPKPAGTQALFICTFAEDEPFENVFQAASEFPEIIFLVTGNHKKVNSCITTNLPKNVKLLGFVSDLEYFSYLSSVDFTIILTNQEFTLNCGSYESISARKPMLLSNTHTIKSYFNQGSIYTDADDPKAIAASLSKMTDQLDILRDEIGALGNLLQEDWLEKKSIIEHHLKD